MKTVSLMTALTAMLAACADIQPLDFSACTEADVRAKVEECMAAPDMRTRVKNLTDSHIVWQLPKRQDMAALLKELDARFAAEKLWFQDSCYAGWPKTCTPSMEATAKTQPVRARLIKKYAAQGIGGCPNEGYTNDELVELLNESISASRLPTAIACLGFINRRVVKIVRRRLYEQGKSFVTKDGVNPCEQYINEFTTALNAPRLAGLNDWLSKMGVSFRVNLDVLPSAEDIATLERDILIGERDITEKDKTILYFGLGAEKYNAFVKRYNGEK